MVAKSQDLRRRARNSPRLPSRRTVYRDQYDRSEYVAAYVKKVAKGQCALCLELAPFHDKDGRPYLECHHVIHLAKGGEDTIENAVALCPNCHRRMHKLNRADDRKRLLKAVTDRERSRTNQVR